MTNLKGIDLSNNVFNHFPPDLCKMKQLSHILLGNNRLFFSPMPPAIGELENLLRLDISGNQLE